MKRLLCFAIAILYPLSLMAEPAVLDRLIVEINGKSYSQRQIEVYQALRTIAMGVEPDKALPSSATWEKAVENFRCEMLVYSLLESDAQRLDSFQADQKKLQETEQAFRRLQANHPSFDAFVRRRQLSEAEINQLFVTLFRVQAYIRSRLQLSAQGSTEDEGFLSIDPNSEWFQSLQKLNAYRFYSKAKVYVPLVPFRS